VQFHCVAVDSNLAEALDGRDDQMLREVLASSVVQLDEALRSARPASSSAKEADETARLTTAKTGASLINRIYRYVAWLTRGELPRPTLDAFTMKQASLWSSTVQGGGKRRDPNEAGT